ncbi:MAG: hypothetical protein CBC09_09565 [Cellvibrionales bacterium TMED49]|nr:MAG: hypothetical protein CBC09_09565 [Cellvibrionales bacterium TMED49]
MLFTLVFGCLGCSVLEEIKTEPYVDLERFMGEWYVVASIPTFLEKEAYNPKESYRLNADGTIATTFTFNSGALDGFKRAFYPTGFVRDVQSNAVWGMQFVWPVKADFRIVFVDTDYSHTIIGRQKRDFLWIMARQPNLEESVLEELIQLSVDEGYSRDDIIFPLHDGSQRNTSPLPESKKDG